MSIKKVPFDDIIYDEHFNHRPIDIAYKHELRGDIERKKELLEHLKVAKVIVAGDDGASEVKYKIVDGAHRFHALLDLRLENADVFHTLVPGDKLEVELVEGDVSALRDRSVRHNTYRKALEPWEVYGEIRRRIAEGQDQYEIAEVLRIQQPRVAEYLSFEKVLTDGHIFWKQGLLSHADMVKLASLDTEDQEKALEAFRAATGAVATLAGDEASSAPTAPLSAKEVKAAKAAARKNLGKVAKEKGQRREYANAGKPTRQKLASYVPVVASRAVHAKTAGDRTFFNAVAAAFKVFNGELSFEKLDPAKTYVSEKEAKEAEKLLAELEAKEAKKAEKAAKAAEKAKAKAKPKGKAKEKPAKAASKAPKSLKRAKK